MSEEMKSIESTRGEANPFVTPLGLPIDGLPNALWVPLARPLDDSNPGGVFVGYLDLGPAKAPTREVVLDLLRIVGLVDARMHEDMALRETKARGLLTGEDLRALLTDPGDMSESGHSALTAEMANAELLVRVARIQIGAGALVVLCPKAPIDDSRGAAIYYHGPGVTAILTHAWAENDPRNEAHEEVIFAMAQWLLYAGGDATAALAPGQETDESPATTSEG